MTQQTVLAPLHRELGARMVDFHGWDMPLHYGSQLDEHHAVRRACGMFDISHMCTIDLTGPDARAFLLRLLANSVDKLKAPGRALYGCMLSEAGGVLDDLIVYFLGDAGYRLVINSATTDSDLAWMAARAADWRMDAAIAARRDLAMIAIQGPQAREQAARARPQLGEACNALAPFSAMQAGELFLARTGYTGEDGVEISLPAAQAPALWRALLALGVAPCGLGARDTLRLEAGLNLYGQDMDDSVSPYDASLGWSVSLDEGRDFVGRAALQSRPRSWQQLGLVLAGGGVLRTQQPVQTAHGDGFVTSGSYSPTMQQSIALARLPAGVAAGDEVAVLIRERLHPARVVKPPFVRNGRVLV